MIHGIFSLYAERWPFFQELILQHIKIASTAILISGSIGLFLGILISEHRRFATWIIGGLYDSIDFHAGLFNPIYRHRQ